MGRGSSALGALVLTIMLAVIVLPACSGPSKWTGGAMQIVFLPYIQSAEVPSSVVQDQEFTIRLKLTSALAPGLLRGVPAQYEASTSGWAGELYDTDLTTFDLDMWPLLTNPTNDGNVADEFEFPCEMRSPGMHQLRIRSADLPENGGLQFERQLTSILYYPDLLHAKWLEFEIEVLPKST